MLGGLQRAFLVLVLSSPLLGLLVHAGAGAVAGRADARAEPVASVFAQACSVAASAPPAVIATRYGAVRGTPSGATFAFKGIPYAAAPTGAQRWRDPAPPDCWSDVRDASRFGSQCPQLSDGSVIGDEDCLTLNIWTPDTSPANGPLPVMFYIPGGGNDQGSASTQLPDRSYLFDGAVLAQKGNVVVVTINYRLGVFGFLAHPALTAESGQSSHGNYGILDQIMALTWVQQNIAAFGGDSGRVLFFGESAGARDACVLLASPMARGLFARALMESENCNVYALAGHEQNGVTVAEKAGCGVAADVLACLRRLPAASLVAAPTLTAAEALDTNTPRPYQPAIDGLVLTDSPLNLLRSGSANRVPFLIGSNADEMNLFAPRTVSADQFNEMVARAHPQSAAAVLQQYPLTAYSSPRAAWIALSTDALFTCPAREVARAAAEGLGAPVYRYYFTHAFDTGPGRDLGAQHGLELLWVFGHLVINGYQQTPAENALSDAIIGYWSRFAATGNPNGSDAIRWPLYDPAADTYLALDDTISEGHGIHSANCDFWDGLAEAGP
jgi:para-nitrobenzyl esterase